MMACLLCGASQMIAPPLAAGGAPAARQERDLTLPAADDLPAPLVIPADSIGYLCRLDVAYTQRWVPPVVFIAHDPESGRVVVSDPIVLGHNSGLPVRGKVASETAQRIQFTWDYPVGSGSQQTRRMLYRAGIDKADGTVVVTAIPAGFSRVFQARGRCEAAPLDELASEP